MRRVFLNCSGRLAFFDRPATPELWEEHWECAGLGRMIRGCKADLLAVPRIKKYVQRGGRILEGGCGRALIVHALAWQGYRVTGVDYAARTVGAVNEACPELDVRVADVRDLPFEDDEFDGYVSLGVIEHFWNGYTAIRNEMARVVKPCGLLLVSFPHMSALRRVKALLGCYRAPLPANPQDTFYQFALDSNAVQRDFEEAGFQVLEKRTFDGIKGFKDECPLGRRWLQAVYDKPGATGTKARLDRLLRPLASHMCLLVLRRT